MLIPGATAPKIVTRAMVSRMKKGAVIVDVAIDQGGCVETARPTSHSNPSYTVDGVVHYCVTNMPGAVPHTSTLALTNATFPYLLRIANLGTREALKQDPGFAEGLNTWIGDAHLPRSGRKPAEAVDRAGGGARLNESFVGCHARPASPFANGGVHLWEERERCS